MLSWIFMMLAHWNHSLQVEMSLYSNTLFWHWASICSCFLIALCLKEMQQTPVL